LISGFETIISLSRTGRSSLARESIGVLIAIPASRRVAAEPSRHPII
jgi:hypothetical protein